MAKQNNEKIKQYNERLMQKKADDRSAWGNFLPNVSVDAYYNHLNGPLEIDLDPIRSVIMNLQAGNQTELTNLGQIVQGGSPLTPEERELYFGQYYNGLDTLLPHFRETFKDQDYRTMTITATQPLFWGGKIVAAKKYAAAEKRAAAAELTKTENEIARDAIGDYLAVAFMNQLVNLRNNVYEAMKIHKSQAQKLMAEGLIAKYHLLRAEVAVADAGRNLFDDSNRRDLAAIVMAHTLSIDELDPHSLTDSLRYIEINQQLDYFRDMALGNQQILKIIREKRQAARQKYNVERSELLPHLTAFGKYEMITDDLSSLEPDWVIGLNLQFTIFEGAKRINNLQSAKHLQKEVDYLLAGTEKQIALWVEKAYREMRNAEERYLKSSASIDLAAENLRQARQRFDVGMGTSLEIVDAHLELEKVKIESLRSLYDYYIACTDLALACGEPDMVVELWKTMEK
jgi:outer membrane protein TolC